MAHCHYLNVKQSIQTEQWQQEISAEWKDHDFQLETSSSISLHCIISCQQWTQLIIINNDEFIFEWITWSSFSTHLNVYVSRPLRADL